MNHLELRPHLESPQSNSAQFYIRSVKSVFKNKHNNTNNKEKSWGENYAE